MKKLLLLLTLSTAVLCASASNRYVTQTGGGNGDGKSWENALSSVASGLSGRGVGDTVFVAEGVYNEMLSIESGVTLLGGYDAETGVRDPEMFESVIDGTGNKKWSLVKYDGDPAERIVIDGMVFANANHSEWGGAAMYIRGNMTVNNCVFRNNTSGSKAGGIFIDPSANAQTIISNCLFENCKNTAGDQAAAISCEDKANLNALIENCVIRGCTGDVMIYSKPGAVIRNCVIYNNHSSKNGCLYGTGTFINNTVCNNTGVSERYAGARVEGTVVNCVFWGNTAPNAPNVNYVASGKGKNSIADAGSGITIGLSVNNNDATGPNFRNPTTFAGVPTNDGERTLMQDADFSLTSASTALIDKGDATQAPAKDFKGVERKGSGPDIGAYEYDPDAVPVHVTGVSILQDTLKVILGRTGTLVAKVEPANADNKRVTWSIDDETIASIQNGKVTGLKIDTTIAHVETKEGGFTASAVVVVLPVPPVKYPAEVVAADTLYKMEDYTIPSFIKFLVAKEDARIDSLDPDADLSVIPAELDTLKMRIAELVGKEEPYNMIATFNGDPKTHMGFCWFTNGGISQGVVQLVAKGNATASDFAGAGLITINATPTTSIPLHYTPIQATESPKYDICTAAGLPRNTAFTYVSHKALAENLTPGTLYSWRVGYDGHWSEIGQFRTQDAEQGNFSFVYMSDSHIHNAEYINEANQCAKAVAKNEPDAKFCVFPGDFVETGDNENSEWQWERWFEGAIKPTLLKMAIVPTGGNHDVSDNLNYDYHFNTNHNFYEIATTKPQFHGVTYSFVYGDVLFLVYSVEDWWRASGTSESGMKSPYLSTDVRNWFLDQIEKHPNTKYRVTLTHKNLFSGADHHLDSDAPLLRNMMLPILKECGIDLAIQGHDHCYEVIGPVNPDNLTVVDGAVQDVKSVTVNTNNNMTGKEGGTFTTDKGTLYFIGATCGRKRYYPKSREQLESQYSANQADWFDWKHHNVPNYFDLFTSRFGQPGTPSYSRFNVTNDYIEIVTYKTDADGNKEVFNTIRVKNNRKNGDQGVENIKGDNNTIQNSKFIRDGQLLIRRNGNTYNMVGQLIDKQ